MAIEEARQSLKTGNCGFGAVIIKNNKITARTYDTEKTDKDPTAHAEIKAIRMAALKLGNNFNGCTIVSTHEPCPMCATAIAWAGIKKIAYGYPIAESIKQGRNRINISCKEIFKRAGIKAVFYEKLLFDECALLYTQKIRAEIEKLRKATKNTLIKEAKDLEQKRITWYRENHKKIKGKDILDKSYNLFLKKLGLKAGEAPVYKKSDNKLVLHSKNFCPTLEACKILGLKTEFVCKYYSEKPTDTLLKQLDKNLEFRRNYKKLRPKTSYCEEMIILNGD